MDGLAANRCFSFFIDKPNVSSFVSSFMFWIYFWLAETNHKPVSQTTWLKIFTARQWNLAVREKE
eukprot:528684-Pelagomonas_calceolata.AAC.1